MDTCVTRAVRVTPFSFLCFLWATCAVHAVTLEQRRAESTYLLVGYDITISAPTAHVTPTVVRVGTRR